MFFFLLTHTYFSINNNNRSYFIVDKSNLTESNNGITHKTQSDDVDDLETSLDVAVIANALANTYKQSKAHQQ